METSAKNRIVITSPMISVGKEAQANLLNPNLSNTVLINNANLYEDDDAYEIDLKTPAKPEGLNVELNNRVLTVSGEDPEEQTNACRVVSNYPVGPFKLSIALPCDVIEEEIITAYRDGILKIIIPKVRGFLSTLRLWSKENHGGYLSHGAI